MTNISDYQTFKEQRQHKINKDSVLQQENTNKKKYKGDKSNGK